jgi:hypothetical protein
MTEQLELYAPQPTSNDVEKLLGVLTIHGWTTRKQLAAILSWNPRTIRAVAELAGPDVVRGPKGFNTFQKASTDEIKECAEIAMSQGRKMMRYGLRLKKRLHARIG